MRLIVYSGGMRAGILDMADSEPFYGFTYDADYLSSPCAAPLSLSLPLRAERFGGAQTLPFFEGLLPEGDVRASIARQLGISEHSPAKLLRELGKDCAGDVTVLEEDDPYQPPADDAYELLDCGLELIARNPVGEIARLRANNRLSLAGGQEKIALYHDDRQPIGAGWHVPLAGSPSTHIIKPQMNTAYPQLVYNEFLCMSLAHLVGIDAARVDIMSGERPLLIVQRYDREQVGRISSEGLKIYRRLRQEDFCQALGFDSSRKYQVDGGPGIAAIHDALLAYSAHFLQDFEKLLRLVTFNYLVGNCDAHAKNYSMMLSPAGSIRLAPAYDLVSTTVYDGSFGAALSQGMGMSIGSHSNIDRITRTDFEMLADEISVSSKRILDIGHETAEAMLGSFDDAANALSAVAREDVSELATKIRTGIVARLGVIA